MGRRSTHTSDELRELILKATTELIETDGLSGLSARVIARKIQYSPGTLYNVFQNLDDLILTIEGRLLDGLGDALRQVPASDSPSQHLKMLAGSYLKYTHQNPKLWNLLFEHHIQSDMEIPDWYDAKLTCLMAMVEADVRRICPNSSDDEINRSSRVLWAGVQGITSLSTADKLSLVTTETAGPLVDDLIDTYIKGLTAKADSAK
jgi:AcrR family transcriptional regulator